MTTRTLSPLSVRERVRTEIDELARIRADYDARINWLKSDEAREGFDAETESRLRAIADQNEAVITIVEDGTTPDKDAIIGYFANAAGYSKAQRKTKIKELSDHASYRKPRAGYTRLEIKPRKEYIEALRKAMEAA